MPAKTKSAGKKSSGRSPNAQTAKAKQSRPSIQRGGKKKVSSPQRREGKGEGAVVIEAAASVPRTDFGVEKQPPEKKPETVHEASRAGEFRSSELITADLKELASSIENVESLKFLKPKVESADPATITPDALIGYYRMTCRYLKEEIDHLEAILKKLRTEYGIAKEAGSFINKEKSAPVSEDLKEEINSLRSKITAREQEVDAIREQNNTLIGEISDYQETIKRLSADFTNFRQRQKQANEKLVEYANEHLIAKILPVLDNFDLAIKSSKQNNDFEAMAKGVEMIQSQLNEILMKEGLVPIICQGDSFDPSYHEVLMEEKTSEYPEGIIIEDIRRGFLLKDKLLRPSLVKVARALQEEEISEKPVDSDSVEEFLIEEPVDEGSNEGEVE